MFKAESLVGEWAHSHEEDSGDQLVYRRQGFAFPRARGREEMHLGPGGAVRQARPGPSDKRAWSEGAWSVEQGDTLVVSAGDGTSTRYRIVAVEPDRLVLARS